jgi:hypothetical protein
LVQTLALLLTSCDGDHQVLAQLIVNRVQTMLKEADQTPSEVCDLLIRYVREFRGQVKTKDGA